MKDVKFEQKRSLSRTEAADQLAAIAAALREGGDAELDFGSGTLSLRVPDDLRGELEIEIGEGEIELEIELKWPTTQARRASRRPTRTPPEAPAAPPQEATPRKSAPKKTGRTDTGTRSRSTKKPTATKQP